MQALLEIKNLSLNLRVARRETPILKDITLSVNESESVAIVGETGSGKTLTAKTVMGILPKNSTIESGEVLLNGVSLLNSKNSPDARRKIAMIFQNPMSSLNPLFKVGTQLNDVLTWSTTKKSPITRQEREERIWTSLRSVRLDQSEKILDRYPFELSGGMKQRVMIAMALLKEPELLIADEPTTALDVTTQKIILELLLTLARTRHMSLLLITHNLGIAYETSRRTFVFYAGRIVEGGLTMSIFKAPLHPYTRGLIESIPSLDKSRTISGISGEISAGDRGTSACCFNSRCPMVMKTCREENPQLKDIESGHQVACFVTDSHANAKKIEK